MRTAVVKSGASALIALLCLVQGCSRDDGGAQQSPDTTAPGPAPAAPAGDAGVAPSADAGAPTSTDAATASAAGGGGAQTFQTYCQTCHGPKGAGDGPAAAGLNPKPASFASGDFRLDPNGNGTKGEIDDIKAVVRDGAAKYGGSPLMAPWPMLTPEQLQGVAEHVKSLGGQG